MSCNNNSYNTANGQNNTRYMQNGAAPIGSQMRNMPVGTPPMNGQQRNMQTRPTNQAVTTAMPIVPGGTPSTVQSPYYTAGFLTKYIGQNMRVEFLIGTSGALVDRAGTLVEVGASYIVLQPFFSDDLLMCDLYSIKFVNIIL